MPSPELPKQTRVDAIASLRRYAKPNLPEPLGELPAAMLLDFLLEEIGPALNNRGSGDGSTSEKFIGIGGKKVSRRSRFNRDRRCEALPPDEVPPPSNGKAAQPCYGRLGKQLYAIHHLPPATKQCG